MNPQSEILNAVRDHCRERYNERYGYSAVIECFDDDELLDILEHPYDVTTALSRCEEYVKLMSDHYEDIRNA
jgi:hypothetical protein